MLKSIVTLALGVALGIALTGPMEKFLNWLAS